MPLFAFNVKDVAAAGISVNRPPSITTLFAVTEPGTAPRLPSSAKVTSAPVTVIFPEKVFDVPVISIVPPPEPAKVKPAPALPEIIPLNTRLPLAVEFVIVRDDAPKSTGQVYVEVPVPETAKSPPITIEVFAKVFVPVELSVPPLIVRAPPPNEKVPLPVTLTVPAFRVNPPV